MSYAAYNSAKFQHFTTHITVDSMLTWSLLVGKAQVRGSCGIEADQAGKPARWTMGKSNDIIPHISSASLGAHQRDHVRFLRGAPPMYVIAVRCNNAWDVKTNHLIDNLIYSLILALCWIIEPRRFRSDTMKNRILSQIKCLQYVGCLERPKEGCGCHLTPKDSLIRFQPLIQLPPVWQTSSLLHASQWWWMHYLEMEKDLWGMMHKYKSCWCQVLTWGNYFLGELFMREKCKIKPYFSIGETP